MRCALWGPAAVGEKPEGSRGGYGGCCGQELEGVVGLGREVGLNRDSDSGFDGFDIKYDLMVSSLGRKR